MYDQLSQLEHCYRSTHRALDSTRHEITLEGFMPADEGVLHLELSAV